jgi:hypothetical protein
MVMLSNHSYHYDVLLGTPDGINTAAGSSSHRQSPVAAGMAIRAAATGRVVVARGVTV